METAPMATRRPLTMLSRELRRTYGQPVSYYRLWNLAVLGRIPAEQGDTGRWSYDPADLPAIAAGLGLNTAPIANQAAA